MFAHKSKTCTNNGQKGGTSLLISVFRSFIWHLSVLPSRVIGKRGSDYRHLKAKANGFIFQNEIVL